MNNSNGEQRNEGPINIQGLQGGENVQQLYSTSGEEQFYGPQQQFQPPQGRGRGHGRGSRGIKRGVGRRAAEDDQSRAYYLAEPQFYPGNPYYYNRQQFYEPIHPQPSYRGGQQFSQKGYYPQNQSTMHQIHHRSRGKPNPRGRGVTPVVYVQPVFPAEFRSRPPVQVYAQQPTYIVHKRQYSNVNKDEQEIPLTQTSRVLRRGRGTRNVQEPIHEEVMPEEEYEIQQTRPPQQHKIIKKSHGRGQRAIRVAGATGGIDSFDSEENQPSRPFPPTYDEYYRQGQYDQRPYGDEEYDEVSEGFNSHYQPEYEMPYDYSTQYPKRPQNGIKYRLKTFDDEIESDMSFDENASGDNVRRGPKLIKFKQKKPSERLALSQLKSEQSDKNEILDIYTPLNTQTNTNKIQILKPYRGFEQPEFYQGPQWKFIRQSTNQNSKQKHYEKGEYDKVQYNFPGAENDLQDKETDGEQKLYPPIEDYSDEDVGIAPSSSNLRAKVTFNKSTRAISEESNINILQNAFEQQKVAKCKKPAVSNKAFTFDQKKVGVTSSQESLLIQGLTKEMKKPVTMEFAEKFFVQEQEQLIEERKNNKQFFEKYINDQTIIDQKLQSGHLWKGVVRMNPKFRHRAYVSIQELNIDVLVESYRMMNRALDGDTVLIELLPVHSWIEMGDQNSLQAKVTTLCNKTGLVQHGMSHLKQGDNQAYTNENAIEIRMVDKQKNSDQLSMSQSQSEDDTNIQPLNKIKGKKFNLNEEDVEGYNASNSDNNFDCIKFNENKKRVSGRKCSDVAEVQSVKVRNDKMSQSSCGQDRFEEIEEKGQESSGGQKILSDDDKDLWEHLETVGIKCDKVLLDSDTPADKNKAMTIAEFLGKENTQGTKTSSYNRIELHGTKEERIFQINDHGRTLRPLAKVVGLTNSPNRECNQMVTLVEIEQDSSSQLYQPIKTKTQRDRIQNSLIFAVPVNDKLPWFILDKAPDEFIKDQNAERNPSHRYYVIKYQDWKTTQKRPHCTLKECIGEAGNLQAESLRLLKMHDICTEQYEVEGTDQTIVHECLKVFTKNIDSQTNEWKIPKNEIAQRLDLREKRIFTIDPITARDLDDALSIEKISDKIYEIGVHIADVSYFVQQGSDLDKEALKRSTSTYFVHKVYPMLPRLLCEQLCSLNPNVDRLTYSIFFRMDIGTGSVDKTFKPVIKRSIIRSCAKWNYELAQKVIKGKVTSVEQIEEELRPQGHSFLDMAQDLLLMNSIAQKRRKERLEAGSLVFNNREFNFTLNQETLYPINYTESSRMESKQLVEEYMLLANILVAECLFDLCKDRALLRAHADIVENKKNDLGNFFKKIGLEQINLTDAKTLSESIAQLEQEKDSQDKLTVVNRKFISNLTQAKYVCVQNKDPEDFAHYGLNFSLYTHFTSPIRRYADLLVHRLLTICLKEGENTRDKIDGLDYSEYAEIISEQSYNSRKASKECQQLFHCFLLKDQGPRVYECLIFDLETSYLNVYVEELNLNLSVKLREDDRIDQTTFFEDEMKVACSFKTPQMLVKGLREYQGEAELKKSKQQKKKEEEIRRMEQDNEDLQRRLNKSEDFQYRVKETSNGQTNCIFSVFDRVKIKVEATDTFPMEISATMLITQEDMLIYQEILTKQEIKLKEIEQMTQTMHSDGSIQQIEIVNEEI